MKNDTRMWLRQTIRNEYIAAESKITKSQPENSFYSQSPNLMLTMCCLLLEPLEGHLHTINLHLDTFHQQPHLCAAERLIGFTRAKWKASDIMGNPNEVKYQWKQEQLPRGEWTRTFFFKQMLYLLECLSLSDLYHSFILSEPSISHSLKPM